MARYINADELTRHIEKEQRMWDDAYDIDQVLGDIEDFPTIEVVRCKECKYQFTSECYCVREYYVNGKEFGYPGDDFFCKKGERR